jgi:purine-nucleoside phosphorylase
VVVLRDHLNLMFRDPGRPALNTEVSVVTQVEKPDEADKTLIPHSASHIPHSCYDPRLCAALLEDALAEGIPLKEVIYAAVTCPSYETRAEAAMLRLMGGDAVGMSTVPEALAAVRAGLRVAAVSLVTNSHWHRGGPACHNEVLAAAAGSGERLRRLLGRTLERLTPRLFSE